MAGIIYAKITTTTKTLYKSSFKKSRAEVKELCVHRNKQRQTKNQTKNTPLQHWLNHCKNWQYISIIFKMNKLNGTIILYNCFFVRHFFIDVIFQGKFVVVLVKNVQFNSQLDNMCLTIITFGKWSFQTTEKNLLIYRF